MLKTSDHAMFHKLPGNRDIDPLNLKKITASMRISNMLELKPIIVNGQMQVMDGQHRLEAAKILGLEVFYQVEEKIQTSDIILLQTQKTWGIVDYIKYHASQGNKSYMELVKLADKLSLDVKDLTHYLNLPSGGNGGRVLKGGNYDEDVMIKEGDVKEKIWKIEQVKRLIDEKTLGNKLYLTAVCFRTALLSLLNNTSFDFDTFINKLNMGLARVHRCTMASQYYDMFKGIYNYRNQDPID